MRILFVDLALDRALWAIKDGSQIVLRGYFANVEEVRALQKMHGIDWVKIDGRYRKHEAQLASELFGWEFVTHPLAHLELEEAVHVGGPLRQKC